MRALLLLVLATAAAAQPRGDAILDAWASDWRSAVDGVDELGADERTERTFSGPRGEIVVEVEARLRYTREGRPQRDVRRVFVDGQEVDPTRDPRQRRRFERAFGEAGREVSRPPLLPIALLGRAPAGTVTADRVDGTSAWRVALITRENRSIERAEAWFSRSDRPRLLRLRVEGSRPRGGRLVHDTRYTRVEGLDLPAEIQSTFTTRQRRRLRQYVVTLTSQARYRNHVLR